MDFCLGCADLLMSSRDVRRLMCEIDIYLTWKLLMKEDLIDTMAFLSLPQSWKNMQSLFQDLRQIFQIKYTKLKAHLAIVAFRACKDSSTPTPAPSSPPLPLTPSRKRHYKGGYCFPSESENTSPSVQVAKSCIY